MFADTHAHLDFKQFDRDRDDVVERAKKAGVGMIVTVGTDIETSEKNIGIAEKYDGIYAAVGIHPSESDTATDEQIKKLRELARNKKVAAIGECGLDFFKMYKPRDVQIAAFEKQVLLAKELNLPLIVHSRGAEDECIDNLLAHNYTNAVLHCFGGSLAQAKRAWGNGIMTSFTGTVTYPNADELRAVVGEVPDNLFMIETDCPFLAPQSCRGQRNEPAFIAEIAEKIAGIKSVSIENVGEWTTKNARNFFAKLD